MTARYTNPYIQELERRFGVLPEWAYSFITGIGGYFYEDEANLKEEFELILETGSNYIMVAVQTPTFDSFGAPVISIRAQLEEDIETSKE